MDYEAVCEERLFFYDILRRLYFSPQAKEVLPTLKKIGLEVEGCMAESEIAKGLTMLMEASAGRGEEIDREFARLFIGPGQIPAPPYESCYTSERRALMQESAIAVRKKYLEAGLVMKNLFSSPEDHVASEFEFMYYLSQKSFEAFAESKNEAAAKFLRMQLEFLEQHLSMWIPRFCENIVKSTTHEFFRGLALLTRAYVAEDLKTVNDMIESLGASR